MKIDTIERQSGIPLPSGANRVAAIAAKTLLVKKHRERILTLPSAFARTRSLYSSTHLVILASDAIRHGIPFVAAQTVKIP
jgi:hypothetical protein